MRTLCKTVALSLGLQLVFAASLAAQSATTPADSANAIHVVIRGLRTDNGHVLCALFASAADFPGHGDKAVARAKSVISGNQAQCDFTGIQPGKYAISVIHDENDNGKMDTRIFGIPREGVGASNDAKGRFGPPKFDAAAFDFAGGQLNLVINIGYIG